jgi:hypothetical protein
VQCGDVLCAEGELCVYDPGFLGCCSGTDGSTGTTAGETECDTGYDAIYRCESYPDTCRGDPDPFDCLDYFFCGAPPAPFSKGFLECPEAIHDCTTGP